MSTRDGCISRMQAKVEEWDAVNDTLTAKASEVSADVRSTCPSNLGGFA